MVDDCFIPTYCILPKKCVVKEISISKRWIRNLHRPKALGDIRGVTYIYGMFYRFGLIDMPDKVNGKMKRAGRQMWHSKDGWRLLLLIVSYQTNILLLPLYPSKTRPVKFQSKNRRESAGRATNNLLHSGLVSAHPHKIHPKITPQSRKITDWGEYLGRADAPAEAPGPQALWRMINENMHNNSHKYTDKKRNEENLKITLKRGIIVVRTSRV